MLLGLVLANSHAVYFQQYAHQLFCNNFINLLSPLSNLLGCVKIIHIQCALQLGIQALQAINLLLVRLLLARHFPNAASAYAQLCCSQDRMQPT